MESVFKEGNEFLKQAKYVEAIEKYKLVDSDGMGSFGLYKNMALSYAHTNHDAYAILYYEKCLKLQPNDKVTLEDLKIIRQRNPDISEGIPSFFLVKIVKSVAGIFSPLIWSILSLICLGFIGFLMINYYPSYVLMKKQVLLIAGLGITFLSFTLMAYYRSQQVYGNKEFIVIEKDVKLRVGPDAVSPEKMDLPSGAKVIKAEEIGTWIRVITNEGDDGWILVNQVLSI
jgi:tetratricopeptide (TPR) repeat protein